MGARPVPSRRTVSFDRLMFSRRVVQSDHEDHRRPLRVQTDRPVSGGAPRLRRSRGVPEGLPIPRANSCGVLSDYYRPDRCPGRRRRSGGRRKRVK